MSSLTTMRRRRTTTATPARTRATRPGDEIIHGELYDAIIDHRIPPGTALPEDTLAGAFGVSRTVVRKALIRLAHERLIELRRNRGAVVARPSVEEARQVFEARRVIEAAVVAGAVERIDTAEIERLRAHLDEERAARRRGDRRDLIRLTGEFHRRLAEIAGNEVLGEVLRGLISRTSLIIALYERPGLTPCSREEHAALLDAIARRDSAAAAALMREHLDHCERELDLAGADRAVDLHALFAHVRDGGAPAAAARERRAAG